MQALVLFISIAILFTGAIMQRQKTAEPENILGEESNTVIGPTLTNTPSPELTPPPAGGSTPIPTSTATQSKISSSLSLDVFHYTPSIVKNSNTNSLILESDDNPDTITDWYKEKIKTMGMNTKSFVTTKTNGTIKNVLVGANGKEELRVEISKLASENFVRIVVTYHTS